MSRAFSVVAEVSKANTFGSNNEDNFGICSGPIVLLWQRFGVAQHPLHRVKGSTPGVLAGAEKGKEQVGGKGDVPELRDPGAELHLQGSQRSRKVCYKAIEWLGLEETFKDPLLPTPCRGQGHLPLDGH